MLPPSPSAFSCHFPLLLLRLLILIILLIAAVRRLGGGKGWPRPL